MKFQDFNGEANKKCTPKKDAVMQWHTQWVKITNSIRVKIDFTLPELTATKIMTWNFHVDESANIRYDMILGRYLLTALGLNI